MDKRFIYASFQKRIQAFGLDTAMLGLIILVDAFVITTILDSFLNTLFLGFSFIILFIVPQFIWNGQSIGKRIVGIKTVSLSNQDIHPIQIIIRPILKYTLAVFTFGVSMFVSFVMLDVRDDKKSLHDIICMTKVIDLKYEPYRRDSKYDSGFHVLNKDKFKSGLN